MQTSAEVSRVSDEAVRRGQAVYTPSTLAIYDAWVLGISNSVLWRCPTHRLLRMYAEHLSDPHLEAGVGTAYMLDHTRFHVKKPRLTLLDINPSTLAYGSRRLRRYQPRVLQHNLLEPLTFDTPYKSIALNYVLHCLPGAMRDKAVVFEHLRRGLAKGGVLFGATLLGRGVALSAPARALMAVYNRKGIFSNEQDDADGLAHVLSRHFERYQIEQVGCAALFTAYS